MSAGLSRQQLEKFEKDGILIIEDFLTKDEVCSIRNEIFEIVENLDPQTDRGVFSTTGCQQASDTYFLESGDKIRYFFETSAFSEEGQLQMDKHSSLNKIGHALHYINPVFRKISFSQKVQMISRSLSLRDPAIVQGMYIFKNPGIGGEVTPHQDGTFLYNEPLNLFGFWFPIDDATEENGCLWYVPGSHSEPVTRRFLRTGQVGTDKLLEFKGEDKQWPDSAWVAAPVPSGSLVLIHGQVYHKSEQNTSLKPRHAYTFHVIETEGSHYASKNWLQPTKEPLPRLYFSSRNVELQHNNVKYCKK